MPSRPPLAAVRDRRPLGIIACCLLAIVGRPSYGDEERDGAGIYRQRCASCHGAAGEGSQEYPRPLAGDRSVAQLSRLIARTMPEDDPGTCVGEEAEKVAAYIHESFYSNLAQARNRPARIELSRLTVRQHRNAVADLIGSFRPSARWEEARGLRGGYFKSRRYRPEDRVFERIDPEVRFDFKEAGPDPEQFEPNQFSIRWEGSVLALDTGEYEFIVRTEHAARLWVNDLKSPLIDALVKSGNDVEHRGSISLLGGRAYPLRLEFSKAKQGVDDSKKTKEKPPAVKASISLEWKPPRGAAEVIPTRNLTPVLFPETFVSLAPFPPDDRSVGYERGASVSKAWDAAATDVAIEAAGYVSTHLRELSGVAEDAADRNALLREFALRFAERAFRRPLTEEEKEFFVARQFGKPGDVETAVKRVVLLVLKSPRFLYREVRGDLPDSYAVASRVSFGLWDSLPDQALLEAAAEGRLANHEQAARQVERMMGDLRSRAKIREFFFQWLKADRAAEASKDPQLYPGFDEQVLSDLRVSLDLFLEDVIWGEDPDFRRLLRDDALFLNGRLARFYGADLPADAPFRKVPLDPSERAGVLTHPYLMANFSYTATTSPIHRGVFLARSVLGRSLRPPPEAVSPLAPELHAGLSTRERVTLQTSPSSCMTCHGMINPLGFALERFDAVGRYRGEEKGRPIDATGVYETRSGKPSTFSGARELADLLAGSEETHSAFVEQLFHHLVKQPIRAYGPLASSRLRQSFIDNNFHIRKLMVEIVATSAAEGDATSLPEDVFQPNPREH